MAGLCDKLAEMYERGQSIPQISGRTGINRSRVRSELLKAGVPLRSRTEGIRIREGLGQHLKGKARIFSQEWKDNISAGRNRWADANAKGTRITSHGYVEYTRGPHKNRMVHTVMMEDRLGRALKSDEEVHHIDENRQNNADNNLALLTNSGHGRLHRILDALRGKERKRSNGRYC